MSHRGHRPPLDQLNPAVARSPVDEPGPRKLGPPAETPRDGRERQLENFTRAAFRADMVHQNQFAAGLQHAHEIVEGGFRLGHGGDDVLRDHGVEGAVGERQMLGVHHRQRLHIGEVERARAFAGLAQHRLRNIDAADFRGARIIGQRQAGADADIENAPADLVGQRDRGLATGIEDLPEDEIIDRCPSGIRLRHSGAIDVVTHDGSKPP